MTTSPRIGRSQLCFLVILFIFLICTFASLSEANQITPALPKLPNDRHSKSSLRNIQKGGTSSIITNKTFNRKNEQNERTLSSLTESSAILPRSTFKTILRNSVANSLLAKSKPICNLNPNIIIAASIGAATTVVISFPLVKAKLKKMEDIPTQPKLAPTNPYLRAITFWRKAGPIVVHYKFVKKWCKHKQYPFEKRDEIWNTLHHQYAPEVRDIMIQYRGLFVKLGQVLSARADFMPEHYIEAFSSLQDNLPPKPFSEIKKLVQHSLYDINQDLEFDEVFESFDETPLGTASIGQVHRAVLKSAIFNSNATSTISPTTSYCGGPMVAVKVMHPASYSQFKNDFKIFKWLCKIGLPGWMTFLEEVRRQMMTEFNYIDEAESLQEIRANMKQSMYAKYIQIPEPIMELSSRNLLVMEMLNGKKLSDHFVEKLAFVLDGDMDLAKNLLRRKQKELRMKPLLDREKRDDLSKQPMKWMTALNDIRSITEDDKLNSLFSQARMLIKLYTMKKEIQKSLHLLLNVHGHQIFINGVFNGDPHPGNILHLEDGRLGLIDYGQVKRLNAQDRVALSKIVLALEESNGKIQGGNQNEIAEAMREFGFKSLRNKDDVLAMTAELYFDSNAHGSKLGYPNPQGYFQYLSNLDPLVEVPPSAVMVARTSFLFRGMGGMLQQDIRTAKFWSKQAKVAIQRDAY